MTRSQRERDIDCITRHVLALCQDDFPVWLMALFVRLEWRRDKGARIKQAARSLSCAGHAKRRSKIDRTTAELRKAVGR